MATVLPRPTVTVSESADDCGNKSVTITASRDNKSTAWQGNGATTNAATKDAVEKMLNDRTTAEYVP